MTLIRVLVVDDSAFMRKVITDIVNTDPELEVVGKAKNGEDALQKVKELHPDVITMDVEMPGMDGLAALDQIMKVHPVPVIMLSSLTKHGAEQTVKALQLGAVDFIPKPSGQISLDIETVRDDIVRKVKIAAGTKKKLTNFIGKEAYTPLRAVSIQKSIDQSSPLDKVVLIGTSTGGPKALHEVVPRFPAQMNAAVLIVQHMPPGFTRSLAERLDTMSPLRVKEAEQGEKILPGCVYIAPGDYHLTVRRTGGNKELYVNLTQDPPRGGHRPSVNTMLESVAAQFWGQMVCVIMTGMGSDGSQSLDLVKNKGGRIIAEHQSTCIVYGMPKAAVETGTVDRIVPLQEISSEVIRLL